MTSVADLQTMLLTPPRLRAEGLDPNKTSRWVAQGRLVRIRRGVYVRPQDLAGIRHEDRQRLRILAYALSARTPPVFCRESAALLYGFAMLRPSEKIHVVSETCHGHRSQDLVVHRAPGTDVVDLGGVLATGIPETLRDCALALPRNEAMVVVESALWLSRVSPTGRPDLEHPTVPLQRELVRMLTESTARGHRAARLWLPFLSSLSESPGETVCKCVLHDFGLPAPDQQVVIGPHRVDFAWSGLKVVLEFDGETKYRDDSSAARVVRAERRRQNLLADAGWTVVRTTWEEVTRRPGDLIRKLRRAGV